MSIITDTLTNFLPGKRKVTPSGWISFNAVCCNDDRGRGGFIVNQGDAVSYHCFNCGFKCSWQPGRHISQKMNKFMRDLHMPDDVIAQLRLEALRLEDGGNVEIRNIIPKFDDRALPMDSILITEALQQDPVDPKLLYVLEYMINRKIYPEDFPFYWTPKIGFSNRLIVPFLFENKIVGYTARTINTEANPKYLSEQQPGYVFNLDNQRNNREFVIVAEGPFDAISIEGCALLGAEIKDSQNWLLKQLNKEIVLVPDRDKAGKQTLDQAVELGWSISMPDWPDGIKDINDAVVKLGKLATLYLIVQAKESNALKIQLRAKKWFKEYYETN
jgi:hypothetical protein